jgi:uncharacterized membrane protein
MRNLIAIGYPAEPTAAAAAAEAQRLAAELAIEPESVAVISRDREGEFRVTTRHEPDGQAGGWGMLWGLLFGVLFFIPVLGMVVGNGLAALMRALEGSGMDAQFQNEVRNMLQPGTSALFLAVHALTPDRVAEALSRFGGTVLTSSLSEAAEAEVQWELHGVPAQP